MSSNVDRAYLSSCLKVPIDPCSNCPAPVFNRSKIYLERLSATPIFVNTEKIPKHCNANEKDFKWYCSGLRSLAKLYNSIPDYRDLNHLNDEEFYSTLNSLRTSYRELTLKAGTVSAEDNFSSDRTSSSLTSFTWQIGGGRSKISKKSKEKKKIKQNQNHKKNPTSQQSYLPSEMQRKFNEINESLSRKNSPPKSSKNELKKVKSSKKSVQEFDTKFKRPSTSLKRNESCSIKRYCSKESFTSAQQEEKKSNDRIPFRSNFTTMQRGSLRKSWSYNDLKFLTGTPELAELEKTHKDLHLFKREYNDFKDPTKSRSSFKENTTQRTPEMSKTIGNKYNSEESPDDRLKGSTKKQRSKKEDYKIPYTLFQLDTYKKHSSPSPIHPVARPNLAATLRVESSKRKVKELESHCTLQDTVNSTQFDWEVRKTPAWKSLSLNETHNQILKIRLATRKAEQALQRREYELNMELMRQRVKSAPLLLEGTTYWGPYVGKVTHNCQNICQSTQQRSKRKIKSSRVQNSSHKVLLNTCPALKEDRSFNSENSFKRQTSSTVNKSNKLKTLCKIYGRNSSDAKSHSRNSICGANIKEPVKYQSKPSHCNNVKEIFKKKCNVESNYYQAVEIDSADELSSLDRAYL